MNKKILLLIVGGGVILLLILLVFMSSTTKNNTKLPGTMTEEQANVTSTVYPIGSFEPDPVKDWIRFYPTDNLKFNLLFPTTWLGDEGVTDTHFVLRSRKEADGSKTGDVTLDFTIDALKAKTLSEQLAANIKGAKDTSPVIVSQTDTGVPYAFATYIDASGNAASGFAVQYNGVQYINIKVTGNIALPQVGRMVHSIIVKK